MTWQLASLAILAFALACGFGWYERQHPTAKVLALVATLAALAALGRLAFAPLPSVKPTTDIVLLSGYVLGGAPGFIVGAVAALASNFFFGQGPFTPWQMVGWGAVGLAGAGLAAVAGRELNRWALAAACGVAGLLYGVWMDFHLWVTYSGHSTGELGVLLGQGVPFNVTHAISNVVFCVAFGPVLVRALQRFRARFEITWRPLDGVPTPRPHHLAGVVVAALVLPLASSADSARAATPVDYLKAAQTDDGGFAEAKGGDQADPIASGWAVIGLAAAGEDPGTAAGAYAATEARKVTDVGDLERAVLALRATGQDVGPTLARLDRKRERNGSFEQLVNRTAFAVLAYRAGGRKAPAKTLRWLRAQQNRDGGWSVAGRGGPSGIDDTAAVMQALGRSKATARAAKWLAKRQGPDGGFPLTPGTPSNAQSTAFAVQAFVAAGRDPEKVRRGSSRSPLAYLRSLQQPDGSIRYSRTSDQTPTWVTAQALSAMEKRVLPVTPKRRNPTRRVDLRQFTALLLSAFV